MNVAESFLDTIFLVYPLDRSDEQVDDRSYYDAQIVAAAQEAGCVRLVSEDFQHGQRFDRVRVSNPFLKGA